MGCGKTTLSNALNHATGITVADLDELIESKVGCTIKEFWVKHGEAAFRELEESTLRQVALSQTDMIVACGGGTPCYGVNMEIMNSCGQTVWLTASHDVLLSRLKAGRHKRPLIAAMDDSTLSDYIISELHRRTPFYSKAHVTFDSSRLENKRDIELTARRFAGLFLKHHGAI